MSSKLVGFNFIISLRQPLPLTGYGTDYNCLFENNTLTITSTQIHDMRYPIGPYGGRSYTQEYKFKSILDNENIRKLEENIRVYYTVFKAKDEAHNVPFPTKVCKDLDNLIHSNNSLEELKSIHNSLNEKYEELETKYGLLNFNNKELEKQLETSQFECSKEIKDLKYEILTLKRDNHSLQNTNKKLLGVMSVLEKKNKSVKNNVFSESNVNNLINKHTTFKRSLPKSRPLHRGIRSRSAKLQPVENI